MKCKRIRLYFDSVTADFQCSECGRPVDGADAFCRTCGHKLRKLPKCLSMEDVCALITRHAEELCDDEKADNKEPSGDWDKPASERPPIREPGDDGIIRDINITMSGCESCPRCRSDAVGCEFLDEGICRGVVYPSYPPQYGECVFQGKHNGKGGIST